MAIRELVTLFTFQVEQTGINKYKAAIGGLKEMALSAGKLFGLAFGAEKIYSFVDGLVDAGKEVNKTLYQIGRLARSQDDFRNIGDTLLDTALKLHVAYTDVADTFKEMLRESQDLKITQDQVLAATENIYKSFRVEKLGADQQKEVLQTLNQVFRRGGLKSERAVNTLYDQSTELMKTLMEAYGVTTVEGMVKLAKAGELTTDSIVEHLSRQNKRLNAEFAAAPVTLAQALTDIYSRLTAVSTKLFKMVNQSVAMGKAVTWAFNLVVDSIKEVIKYLGGTESVIRLLTIAISVLIAAKLVPWIYSVAKAMWVLRWEVWKAMLPWLLWAAAIAAVVLVLEDIYVWMKGGRSAIGRLVGPFSEFQAKLEAFLGPFEKWKEAFISVKDTVVEWSTWIAKALDDSFASIQKFGFDLGKALGIHALVDLFKVDFATIQTSWNDLWTAIGQIFSSWYGTLSLWLADLKNAFVKTWQDIQNAWNDLWTAVGQIFTSWYGTLSSWLGDLKKVFTDSFNSIRDSIVSVFTSIQDAVSGVFTYLTDTFTRWKDGLLGGIETVINKVKSLFSFFSGTPAPSTDATPPSGPKVSAFQPAIPFTAPSVAPGALAPSVATGPVTTNNTPTMNQTNNITVNLTPEQQQIAASIRQQMSGLSEDMIAKMARELTGASPRTEKAAQ